MSSGKWKDTNPRARVGGKSKLVENDEAIGLEVAKERARVEREDANFCDALKAAIEAGLERMPVASVGPEQLKPAHFSRAVGSCGPSSMSWA